MFKKSTMWGFTLFIASLFSFVTAEETNPESTEVIIEEVAPIYVEMVTNKGNILIELDPVNAPNTVGNFVQYVVDGFYDGLIFHRVIPGFMIQGGGFDKDLTQKPTRTPINIESNNDLKNNKGTIAMARTNDPNSATAQFFINTANNNFLNFTDHNNPGYTVFGKVIDGIDIVETIEKVETKDVNMLNKDVPIDAVVIESIKIVNKSDNLEPTSSSKD